MAPLGVQEAWHLEAESFPTPVKPVCLVTCSVPWFLLPFPISGEAPNIPALNPFTCRASSEAGWAHSAVC